VKNPSNYCVSISGRALLDLKQRLTEAVTDETPHMQITKKSIGGLWGPSIEFEFNSLTQMKQITLARGGWGPTWRTVYPGLSWTAECSNPWCEAYMQTVYCNSNFGKFNVAKQANQLNCPVCLSRARGTNLGFLDCRWSFKGLPYRSKVKSKGRGVTRPNQYCTFEEGNDIKWEWLEVKVKWL